MQTNNDTVIAIIITVSIKMGKKVRKKKVSAMRKRKKADTTEPVRASEATKRGRVPNTNQNSKMKRRYLGVS